MEALSAPLNNGGFSLIRLFVKQLLKTAAKNRLAVGTVGGWTLISLILLAGAPVKRRTSHLGLFFRGIWLSLWSTHLRNMVVSSMLVSYMTTKYARARVSLPLSFGTLYLLYYHFAVKENARVQCQGTHWNTVIVERASLATRAYCPTVWAINRHMQTSTCLAVAMLEWLWSKPVTYVRERLPGAQMWDGNEQHLDWVDEVLQPAQDGSSAAVESTPIMLLIHGLGDDRFHPAIMRMARSFRNRGWKVVVWSYWRMDFSETRDLEAIVQHISGQAPYSPLAAIGWSAGGHLLLNYLGTVGKSTNLVCGVALSPAWDFFDHGRRVIEEEHSLYYSYMAVQAYRCVRRHLQNDSRIQNPKKLLEQCRPYKLSDVDGRKIYDNWLAACPSDGDLAKGFSKRRRESLQRERPKGDNSDPDSFKVMDHYPTAAQRLRGISIPCLIVYAEDDPVAIPDAAAKADLQLNRHVILVSTSRGGHCGFYDNIFPAGSTWDARTAAAYIGAVLETLSQTNYMLNILKEVSEQKLFSFSPPEPTKTAGKACNEEADKSVGNAAEVDKNTERRLTPSDLRSTLNKTEQVTKTPELRPNLIRRICSKSDVSSMFSLSLGPSH
eukprot:TRINITY_DN42488_c0_g1_i1.p1 TRINITY_DN42488_c0_g1~~TRINITY_DN42488_c0_g1_i1.p1  ORF type:complete len:608 (+),score=71.96 TRINITY_DN42488_c0_g1_i1:156-1979(+)